jgi:hypothetical protein
VQVIVIDNCVPRRAPVTGSLALSTTGADLVAITGTSTIGWELTCSAAWLIGDADGQERPVAANEIFNVPSDKLANWYAKSASGTPTLYALGARAVNT